MRPDSLTSADVAFYRDNGYFLYRKPVFAPERFARLKAIFEELLARGEHRGDELHVPHFHDARLLDFLLADEVLDLVEPIVGPDIGLFSSHFISKEPFTGRATPWHEDSAYWNGRFDRYDQIVTIWLALDATDEENGAMKVIPGTHTGGFSEYEQVDTAANTFPEAIREGSFDVAKAVTFELAPGECSLHDARLIHGADANRSARRRAGYTMRYFSQTMRYIPENNPGHQIWHARGRNVAGNPVVNG
ncbi:MAG TPA: phytanoyl-CoA dioxygenase family protein [Rhodothermales bacterium]|nr:phytanoyl-CoA dioxygenase family protein [Rhodothermales bacterium]